MISWEKNQIHCEPGPSSEQRAARHPSLSPLCTERLERCGEQWSPGALGSGLATDLLRTEGCGPVPAALG